jgi:hypothetical protein
MGAAKEALLFGKRSKDFCQLAYVADGHTCLMAQKFFGCFFQKSTSSCFRLLFFLSLSGCGGDPNSLCTTPEAFLYPPSPATETLNRVCDEPRPMPPRIAVEAGNVWPGAPAQVPTMVDLRGEEALNEQVSKPAKSAARRARGAGLCRAVPAQPGIDTARKPAVPPGVALGLCFDSSSHE